MLNIYDIIGYVGMGFIVFSFFMKDLSKLRPLNIVGGLLSLIYGILTNTLPTAALNAALVAINISMWIQELIYNKKHTIINI